MATGGRIRIAARPPFAVDARLFPKVLVGCVAVLGGVLVGWTTSRGVGITPDSGEYGFAAWALVAHGHLGSPLGGPLVAFPPGLPILLAAGHALGLSVPGADRALDVISIVLLAPVAYHLGRDATDSAAIGVAVAAGSVLSTATVAVFTMMWSEPPFIVVVAAVLALLVRAVRQRRLGFWATGALVVGASVAVGLRYTGVTLLPVVGAGAYLATRRLGRALVVSAASCAGLAAVTIRNAAVGGSPFGYHLAGAPAVGFAKAGLSVLGAFVAPRFGESIGALLLAAVLVGVIAAGRLRQSRVLLLGGFCVAFWGLLLYGKVAGVVNPTNRLVSPTIPATAVLVAYGISCLRPRWRVAAAMLAGVAIAASLGHNIGEARTRAALGSGFGDAAYRSTPVVTEVAALPRSALLASDQAAVVGFLTDRSPVLEIPVDFEASPRQRSAMVARLVTEFHHRHGYLALLAPSRGGAALQLLGHYGISCRQSAPAIYACS